MQHLQFHPASGGPGLLNREMNSPESTIFVPLFELCLLKHFLRIARSCGEMRKRLQLEIQTMTANEQRSGTMGVPLAGRMANQRRRNASWNDQGN
jgi:hypothetical protein